jgi:hypothetical protein
MDVRIDNYGVGVRAQPSSLGWSQLTADPPLHVQLNGCERRNVVGAETITDASRRELAILAYFQWSHSWVWDCWRLWETGERRGS